MAAEETPAQAQRDVSLAELLAFSEAHAPALRLAVRRRDYGAAARAGAAPLLRHNPTLEVAMGPRFAAGSDPALDLQVSLAQPVELAGERGLRRDAAARLDERFHAEETASRWQLRREVSIAFGSAVLARERVAIALRLVSFADEMLAVARRRLSAGDATAIEVRIAETDAAEARQAKLGAEQELRSAGIELCLLTGWPIETPPSVPASLDPAHAPPTLAAVMRMAAERHPDLLARRATSAEAHARAALADRQAWPTPVFGVQYSREGSVNGPANDIVLGSVELALPLWSRNQGERAESRVDEAVAQADEDFAARSLGGRIALAHSQLRSASERIELFTSSVSASLAQSLSLLERGFAAGELSLLTVAAARERFLRAQLSALDAYADYYRALAELESAVGAPLSHSDTARASGGAR